MKRIVMLVTTVGFLTFACSGYAAEMEGRQAEFRTWTDVTGKHKLEAKFVHFKDGKVRLKKKDGSEVDVPLEKLREADQTLVKDHASNKTRANDLAAWLRKPLQIKPPNPAEEEGS